MACGLYRRTIVRLENDARYVQGQPASLSKLVALYRERRIILDDRRPRRGPAAARRAAAFVHQQTAHPTGQLS